MRRLVCIIYMQSGDRRTTNVYSCRGLGVALYRRFVNYFVYSVIASAPIGIPSGLKSWKVYLLPAPGTYDTGNTIEYVSELD